MGYPYDRRDIENWVYNDRYKAKQVIIQDQYSTSIDLYLCKQNGVTTLTEDVNIDDTSITVVSNTGAVVGDCINIREDTRYFQSIVSNINGNIISFASPLDYNFTTNAEVCFGEWDLSTANGTLVNPIEFSICPPPNAIYDIYEITVSFEDNAVMYESTFGGITQLTNGFIIRISDGYTKNLCLVSNNAGFREYGFDNIYEDKVPSGTYAFSAKKNYKKTNGVSLRIDGKTQDKIIVIVQDNLNALTKLAVTVHGHIVDGVGFNPKEY